MSYGDCLRCFSECRAAMALVALTGLCGIFVTPIQAKYGLKWPRGTCQLHSSGNYALIVPMQALSRRPSGLESLLITSCWCSWWFFGLNDGRQPSNAHPSYPGGWQEASCCSVWCCMLQWHCMSYACAIALTADNPNTVQG